jgi:hypothetical protein
VRTVSVNKQFRVALDSNAYSVPSRHVGQRLTMKAWADRVCLYAGEQLVARHPRSMQRNKDFELPEHAQQLVLQRKSAREQRLLVQFLALSPRAQAYPIFVTWHYISQLNHWLIAVSGRVWHYFCVMRRIAR